MVGTTLLSNQHSRANLTFEMEVHRTLARVHGANELEFGWHRDAAVRALNFNAPAGPRVSQLLKYSLRRQIDLIEKKDLIRNLPQQARPVSH